MNEYTDIKNNTYKIIQRTAENVRTEYAEERKQKIVEELYRILCPAYVGDSNIVKGESTYGNRDLCTEIRGKRKFHFL